MEIVAFSATVTGILAFAGQALKGVLALKSLAESVRNAPKDMEIIIGDIDSLLQVLEASRNIISSYDTTLRFDPRLQKSLVQLGDIIQSCGKEAVAWRDHEALRYHGARRGWKMLLSLTLHEGHKDSLAQLSRRISAQTDKLSLGHSLLGR
jgi:hypothetical protein